VWKNSTVLDGDVIDAVTRLKEEVQGEIVVYASRRLVRTLLDQGLVDELRLIVFPVVLGTGERLFDRIEDKKSLRLRSARAIGDNLALLDYELA
jgi:dihydrofolate reductase